MQNNYYNKQIEPVCSMRIKTENIIILWNTSNRQLEKK